MTQNSKQVTLLFLLGSLVSLILLSASLSNLQLQAGSPFPVADPHYTLQQTAQQQMPFHFSDSIKGLLGLILLLLMIYVPVRLILLVKIKWLLRLIQVAAVLLVLVIVLSFIEFGSLDPEGESSGMGISPPPGVPTSPLGIPPPGLVSFVAIASTLAVGLFIVRYFRRQVQQPVVDDPLLQEAQNAIEALKDGRDITNVIIRCYSQMANALEEDHGIARSSPMTTREFEDLLIARDLPAAPVHGLTNLFEKVRYGRQQLSESDEKSAVESLSEIVAFAERKLHEKDK